MADIVSSDDIKRLFARQDALIQLSKEMYSKSMHIQAECTNFELSCENLDRPERYRFYRQLLLEYLTDLAQLQCELNVVSKEIHKYLGINE